MNFNLFTGWKLEEARAALAGAWSTPDAPPEIHVIETASPARKNLNQTFGEWRVLRAHSIDETTIELTVARELLSEERVHPDSK